MTTHNFSSSIFFNPVVSIDVGGNFSIKLDRNKSPGYDGIRPKVLTC